MTRITFDMGITEAAPPEAAAMIGGEFIGYDRHLLSPRYLTKKSPAAVVETADFLRCCGLCNRRLAPGRDIYMYRGDTAFCSLECREQKMKQDEIKERRAAAKNGENHHPELAAAATTTEGETVAAA
ncbi:hypothetical protein DH2020_046262 [Rehmannia glutinosa]|uniref:FLZ-type domain-containing protein n=1 Tax=Rehmannia glutinosa TaxID=99300 RepID=A0ABR0UBX1_REHGL